MSEDMSLKKEDLIKKLKETVTFMLLGGESPFRARAYGRVADVLEQLEQPLSHFIENKTLGKLPSIGKKIEQDIYDWAKTGVLNIHQEWSEKIPNELLKWTQIQGLGIQGIIKIYKILNITTMEQLRMKCEDGTIAALSGFGKKSAQKILKSIIWIEQNQGKKLFIEAYVMACQIIDYLKNNSHIESVVFVGELRRYCEIIHSIDILMIAKQDHHRTIIDAFLELPDIDKIVEKTDNTCQIYHVDDIRVNVEIVTSKDYVYRLFQNTGSKTYIDSLPKHDLHLQYFESEYDIFKYLDLPYMPPELREREYIGLSQENIHQKVKIEDVKGVIHAHTTYSDGKHSLKEMAEACMAMGYTYFGVSDHSKTAVYAGGLNVEQVYQQWREIDELNTMYAQQNMPFFILKGIESDILNDGSLDYPSDILNGFDFVIASIHSGMEQPVESLMYRYQKAIENPYTTMIAHPTGRLLLRREGMAIDMNTLIDLAVKHHVAIEINVNPRRMDIDWRWGRYAQKCGLYTSINPDAHVREGLNNIPYGINIAAKGLFEPKRILNTFSVEDFIKWCTIRRSQTKTTL